MTGVSDSHPAVGELVRFWRHRRHLTQLEVSVETGVSTRHLSCVETGRSRPSRQLLLHLAAFLRLPLGERNRLLIAGGFAPVYDDVAVEAEDLAPLRQQFTRLMAAHEPNPAVLIDRGWNLVEANRAASILVDGAAAHLLEPPINVLRLTFHPDGLPRIAAQAPACSSELLSRVRHEAESSADAELAALVEEVEGYAPEPLDGESPDGVLSSFEVKTRLGGVRLFAVLATLASPIEVTSSGLALETFLPADEESAALLVQLAGT